MFKSKSAPKGTQKSILFSPQQVVMLDRLMQKFGYFSYGEVIRHTLVDVYNMNFPPYKAETAAGKLKEKKLIDMEEEATITNEAFAASISAPVVARPDGKKFVMVWAWGNVIRAIALDNVKEVFKNNPDLRALHESQMHEKGMPDTFEKFDIFPK